VVLASGLALAAGPAAEGHALLLRAVPGNGAVLQQPPSALTLTFTEQPDPALSAVDVLDSTGRPVVHGRPEPVPGQPRTLRVRLGSLGTGTYTVTWRTISQVDGHVTGGTFAFGIGVAPPPGPAGSEGTRAPWPPPLDVASRWALYAGMSGLVGCAVVGAGLGPAGAVSRAVLGASWALAVLGVLGLGASQAAAARAPLAQFAGTPLGHAVGWRLLPLVAAGALLALDARAGPRPSRWALEAAGGAALLLGLAHALAGHAAAGSGAWRWPNVLVQWLHAASAGAWLGGLAALVTALREVPEEDRPRTALRFSRLAAVLLALVALTGLLRAVDEVGAWGALLSTDFGRVVVVKAGLLLLLAGCGALNRYWSLPAVASIPARLWRVSGAELALAGVALGAAAVLTGLVPPALLPSAAQAAPPVVAEGSDFATTVRLRLEVSPGVVGLNQFTARIVDYDTGRPVEADHVTLRFARPDRPGLASLLALGRTGPGTYTGRGAALSLVGRWDVTALIERGTSTTTVALSLTVQPPVQAVRTIAAPGQPTLYSVDLGGGRVLDVYLDPERPGLNEVHATFIDPSGGELRVPRLPTMTVARSGESPRPIPVRRFGPGHFIGDAELSRGVWDVAIQAVAQDGSVLGARLSVTIR
jgi:putative copper export protein/methionine-rich copper-binding protein CopC/nitrogen fixation protein FixH